MTNKILGKMEATRGFIQIPAKDRDELIGDLITPFPTFVNNEPARMDNYHRLWSPKLKGRFVGGACIIIKKTENGYLVEPNLCSPEHKSNKEDLSNSKSDTKLTLQAAKISIGYKRTCRCPPSHINCMTAKD